ncbi:hypothetical protein VTG60DRAFT_7327 [Thermothelomyces hinnuleus]
MPADALNDGAPTLPSKARHSMPVGASIDHSMTRRVSRRGPRALPVTTAARCGISVELQFVGRIQPVFPLSRARPQFKWIEATSEYVQMWAGSNWHNLNSRKQHSSLPHCSGWGKEKGYVYEKWLKWPKPSCLWTQFRWGNGRYPLRCRAER